MSNIYLTSASADAGVTAGSGTKWKADFTPGASATHLNKNTVVGPTAPLQMTDGAAGTDGTAVSFYTPQLWGVTIAGAITCSLWDRENATANNVAPTIRIERTSSDGTVQSTIVDETTNHGAAEMGTTAGGSADTISVSAANVTDTTLSDGDRLRITLWIDDAAGQGGTGSMASGGRGEFWVNGPNGSQGAAQLAFAEIVCPKAGPNVKQLVESARNNTNPKTIALTGLANGDVVWVFAGGDQFGSSNDITDVVITSSGSIGTVVNETEDLSGTNDDWLGIYKVPITGAGSHTLTITLTRSGGTPGTWHAWAIQVPGASTQSAEDIVTSYTSSSTQVVSVPVDADAFVGFASYDFDAGTVGTPTPGGANTVENSADANYTENSHYWLGQAAGTRNYGTTGAGGTAIRCHAIEILGPSSGTNLVVADAAIAIAADNIVVTQEHILVVQEAAISVVADVANLVQQHNLAIQEANISTLADAMTLVQQHQLALQDAGINLSAEGMALVQQHILAIQEATIPVASENLSFAGAIDLIIQKAVMAMSADNVNMSQVHNIFVHEAFLSTASDMLTLTVPGIGGPEVPTIADLQRQKLEVITGLTNRSVQDLMMQYYGGLSGLTPIGSFSISDHQRVYWEAQTGLNKRSLADLEKAFYDVQLIPSGSNADRAYIYWNSL